MKSKRKLFLNPSKIRSKLKLKKNTNLLHLRKIYLKSPFLSQIAPEKILKVMTNTPSFSVDEYKIFRKKGISEAELKMISNQTQRQRLNNQILSKSIHDIEQNLKALEVKLQNIQHERKVQKTKGLLYSNFVFSSDSEEHAGEPSTDLKGNARKKKMKAKQKRVVDELIAEETENLKLEEELKRVLKMYKKKQKEVRHEKREMKKESYMDTPKKSKLRRHLSHMHIRPRFLQNPDSDAKDPFRKFTKNLMR